MGRGGLKFAGDRFCQVMHHDGALNFAARVNDKHDVRVRGPKVEPQRHDGQLSGDYTGRSQRLLDAVVLVTAQHRAPPLVCDDDHPHMAQAARRHQETGMKTKKKGRAG